MKIEIHKVTVKYSHQAIPRDYEFSSLAKAKEFAAEKQAHNPYVRWIKIDGIDSEF